MKHVVIDIDGTLLDSDHQLRPATKQYLIALQEKGVRVSLASGRTERRMRPIIDALNIDGFCISGNGYKIFHTKHFEEYIVDVFTDAEIQYLFDIVKQYDLEVFTFTDTILNFYLPKHLEEEKIQYKIKHQLPEDLPLVGGPYGVVFNHGKAYDAINRKVQLNESAYKMCVRGEKQLLKKIQQRLSNENCVSMITTEEWLEIVPVNNSKGNALKLLCEKTGYQLHDMVAFGDGENDLSMLTIVGKGFAMDNAQESLKEKVKWIAKSNDEEGVRLALEEIFMD